MTLPHPIRLLCLEDNLQDRDLLEETLRSHGMHCEIRHARTEQEFRSALEQSRFDVILSDYSLPSYNGLAALAYARQRQPETPFLFVSGTIGEERAVEGLKAGATDYVLKNNLARLEPAVRRALGEAVERQRRRDAEESLKESEARFRQVADNIDQAIWLMDIRTNQILYVSPAFERIWQRTRESLYRDPRAWLATIHPEDRERVRQAGIARRARGDYDEAYRIVRPDGSIRWIRDRACPILNDAAEVYRVVGTAEDVTERQHLEMQLRQAQKMEAIGQLASGVAHDFNNLLAVMRGNAEIMLMDAGRLDDEQRECLHQVTAATERAANLTRQLLAFGRKQVMQSQPLNLNELLTNLSRMLSRIIGEHIRLDCRYLSSSAFVQADPGMMEQVLVNLVVNSRDAMPGGGKLILSLEQVAFDDTCAQLHAEMRPGEFVCLTVSDTGTGIAPEYLPRIFEPFFSTKEPAKGTGLGLSTVYGIVKQHQGWIEVSSHPGTGTTFRIFLPALATPGPARADGRQERELPGGTETILLVEDDQPVRTLTRRVLEAYGYQIHEAVTGKEALEQWEARASGIALLLTDMVMPDGVTGRELARKLQSKNPSLKVIYMSGYSPELVGKDTDFISKARKHFLQKPFSSQVLMRSIRNCLDETAP